MDTKTEEDYEKIFARWEKEFPNAPFTISLPDEYLDKLDEPYINQDIVIIKDDRTDSYYYSNYETEYKKKFINNMVIRSSKTNKITLRQILNKMIKNKHYSNEIVISDNHNFLEGFDKINDNLYMPSFGS
jgi:metal-responsive CopG/Arc/MetJ family transcriptional regulator